MGNRTDGKTINCGRKGSKITEFILQVNREAKRTPKSREKRKKQIRWMIYSGIKSGLGIIAEFTYESTRLRKTVFGSVTLETAPSRLPGKTPAFQRGQTSIKRSGHKILNLNIEGGFPVVTYPVVPSPSTWPLPVKRFTFLLSVLRTSSAHKGCPF